MYHIQSTLRLSLPFAALAAPAFAQSWSSSHPDMPEYSIEYSATVAEQGGDNQIFIMGGIEGLSSQPDSWRYHTVSGWTVLSDMPGARSRHEAVTVEVGGVDRIVLLGGGVGGTVNATTTCWWYDPATDTWDTTTPAPMPTARTRMDAVTAPNGKVYVFGGQSNSGSILDSVEIYDPVLNSWSSAPDMPESRHGFEVVSDCDGYIYVYGGEGYSSFDGSVDCFDTSTDTWIFANPHGGGTIPNMPTPRSHFGAALGRDGKQYIISGNYLSPVPIPTVEAFDPYTNTWSIEPSVLETRHSFEAVAMGSRVFIFGGDRKIYPWTTSVHSYGGLSTYGPCSDDVPSIAIPTLGASFQSATFHPGFNGGIIDTYLDSLTSAWVSVQVAGLGDVVIDPDPTNPNHDLETRIYASSGQLLTMARDNEPAYVAAQTVPGGRVVVEIRNVSQGQSGAEFSLMIEGSALERPVGEVYCSPATPNSTGDPSSIQATGLSVAAANDLTLTVMGLPQQSFGYFLVSRSAGSIQHPGGSAGTLCLSGNIGRFAGNVLNSGSDGAVALDVNLLSIPGNPPAAAHAGDTWYFTYWHRDFDPTGVTSNFSDAVRILFE